MMNYKDTLQSAIDWSNEGKLIEWLHIYLNREGNNINFSNWLKQRPAYLIGPVKMSLNLFTRTGGPEPHMKFQVHPTVFENKIAALQSRYQKGWDMPPLIIKYKDNQFILSDGNHRYEALLRDGITEYFVIIWTDKASDSDDFLTKYSKKLPPDTEANTTLETCE